MQSSFTLKVVLGITACASLFWLPWIVTIICMFCAGLTFPGTALGIGILADILYYPGFGYVWGTITGALVYIACLLVRHLVKTRIM